MAAQPSNRRRSPRTPARGRVDVQWAAEGLHHQCVANALDISRTGMEIEMPLPVEVDQRLNLVVQALAVRLEATVRHTISRGHKWIVGIEFREPLP